MTTFGIMKTRIVDETLRDDLTATQLANAINDAIELQEGERFKFNERRYRILTVADQEYYDLTGPTLLTNAGAAVGTGETILEIDTITVTVSQSPYPLCPRTQQWFAEQWASATFRGQPASYGLYGQQLRIYPVPDGVYQIDMAGLARLAPNPLSGDADTNAWMTDGAAIIRGQAKLIIYRNLRDADGVQLATDEIVRAGGNPNPASAKRKMAAQAFTGRQKAWSL